VVHRAIIADPGRIRGKLVEALERAYRTGQLELTGPLEDLQHPVVFDDLIDRLYTHNWVVYAKPPFAGPEKVLEYLARYTHRVAISNERLICLEDDEVVFRYKDYARGGAWRTRRLAAEELIRRFLQHVLPDHFVRIRYFGMLANRHRREQLERARHCLQASSGSPNRRCQDPSISISPEVLYSPGNEAIRIPWLLAYRRRRAAATVTVHRSAHLRVSSGHVLVPTAGFNLHRALPLGLAIVQLGLSGIRASAAPN
jgi:hypothetical protein